MGYDDHNPVPTTRLKVNDQDESIEAAPGESLLFTLRERLELTGPRGTCGIGVCGSCTVLVDGKVASSCLMLTSQVEGRNVTTPEGLGGLSKKLSDVQEAFIRRGAYQCSFCIPAMVLSVHAAIQDENIPKDKESIREFLAGNLCRCGTYPEVLEAVADLVETEPEGEVDPG